MNSPTYYNTDNNVNAYVWRVGLHNTSKSRASVTCRSPFTNYYNWCIQLAMNGSDCEGVPISRLLGLTLPRNLPKVRSRNFEARMRKKTDAITRVECCACLPLTYMYQSLAETEGDSCAPEKTHCASGAYTGCWQPPGRVQTSLHGDWEIAQVL